MSTTLNVKRHCSANFSFFSNNYCCSACWAVFWRIYLAVISHLSILFRLKLYAGGRTLVVVLFSSYNIIMCINITRINVYERVIFFCTFYLRRLSQLCCADSLADICGRRTVRWWLEHGLGFKFNSPVLVSKAVGCVLKAESKTTSMTRTLV